SRASTRRAWAASAGRTTPWSRNPAPCGSSRPTMASTDEVWDPAFDVPEGFVRDLFRLDGQVAVVTGGGSGLGAAMAKGLAQAGAALAIVDVNEDGAASTVATIEEQGGRAVSLRCDVTVKLQVDALADRVVDELGRAD